ncbi:hypothetical protein [Streptomyces sp. NPDC000405]|uniref:hypothetical protein n=1 Tax=Streptomyces sp. NPDC000405 TaxID=3161033 RepID=UPI00398D3746
MPGHEWLFVAPSGLTGQLLDPRPVERAHGAVYLLPAPLAGFGHVHLPAAGGCRIGDRNSGACPAHQYAEALRRRGIAWALPAHALGTPHRSGSAAAWCSGTGTSSGRHLPQ